MRLLTLSLLILSTIALPLANPATNVDTISTVNDNKPKTSGNHGGSHEIVLIFARGTTETGTMGITVGPALSNALKKEFGGSFSAEGVSYPADQYLNITGAVSGGINVANGAGARSMASMAQKHLAVTFGDPTKTTGFGSLPATAHLSYKSNGDIAKAAQWLKSVVK